MLHVGLSTTVISLVVRASIDLHLCCSAASYIFKRSFGRVVTLLKGVLTPSPLTPAGMEKVDCGSGGGGGGGTRGEGGAVLFAFPPYVQRPGFWFARELVRVGGVGFGVIPEY